jgi:hypothetical protein
LPTTNGAYSTPRLRVASLSNKLRAFLRQADELRSSDFPQKDSKDVLDAVREHARGLYDRKKWKLRRPTIAKPTSRLTTANDEDIDNFVKEYTPILGILLRSTNVRNAFELFFPLKRLAVRATDKYAKLVISTEWDFKPFAYLNPLVLPDAVLVSGPASEAGNVLLSPIAGHEIGHAAWRHHDALVRKIGKSLNRELEATWVRNKRLLSDVAKDHKMTVLDLRETCEGFLLRKAEEVFCDLFGLYIFGASYLYAYEHLVAPGSELLSHHYPIDGLRMQFLAKAAKRWKIRASGSVFQNWVKGAIVKTPNEVLGGIADKALSTALVDMIKATEVFMRTREFDKINRARVRAVKKCLAQRVPYGGATLPEIALAGWEYIRARGGMGHPDYTEEMDLLHELMLKSVEASEYQTLVEEHRERKRRKEASKSAHARSSRRTKVARKRGAKKRASKQATKKRRAARA